MRLIERPRRVFRPVLAGVLVMVFGVVSATDTQASGLSAPRTNGWSMVTLPSPVGLSLNPALLARLNGVQAQLDATVIAAQASYQRVRHASYQRSDGFGFKLPVAAADIDPAKTGPAQMVQTSVLLPGAALAASFAVTDKMTLGLAAVPGAGAQLMFPHDGPHAWQVSEVFMVAEYVTLGVGIQLWDKLAVGVAGDLIIATMSLRHKADLAATDMLGDAFANPPINQPNDFGTDAPPGVRELDALSRDALVHEATALGGAFKLGANWTPSDTFELALAYQHGVDLVYVGDFYLDMNHSMFTTDLSSQGLQYKPQIRGKAFVSMPLPGALRLGGRWTASDKFSLHAQLSWVRWSAVKAIDVTAESADLAQPKLGLGTTTNIRLVRNWQDTVEAEVLADIALGGVRFGIRGGYHSPVSKDEWMDLAALDGHRIVAGVGAKVPLSDRWTVTANLAGHRLITRVVGASHHDRGNGTYNLAVGTAGVGLIAQW